MKLAAQFTTKDNTLFFLDGTPLPVTGCPLVSAEDCKGNALPQTDAKICMVNLPWSLVGMDEESYNEEFLAAFRDWLKMLETKQQYAVMVPVTDCPVSDAQKADVTASMNHAARRIKDCTSVAGFAIPQGFSPADSDSFIEELSRKHAQYVYFSQDNAVLSHNIQIVRY